MDEIYFIFKSFVLKFFLNLDLIKKDLQKFKKEHSFETC